MENNNVTNELIYEVLKTIQSRLERQEDLLKELHEGQLRTREDANAVRGDVLRLERQLASLDVRLGRIEKRLNLVDA